METADNREKLFELDEIYKYQDLIEVEDRDVIKAIIFDRHSGSTDLYEKFLRIVS